MNSVIFNSQNESVSMHLVTYRCYMSIEQLLVTHGLHDMCELINSI
jgi:hypothetical protein